MKERNKGRITGRKEGNLGDCRESHVHLHQGPGVLGRKVKEGRKEGEGGKEGRKVKEVEGRSRGRKEGW